MSLDDVPIRKAYPRLRAPVYFTRLGFRFFRRRRKSAPNAQAEGIRVYTDEEPKPGSFLEMEVFLPDGTSVLCKAEVAWVDALPHGGPARFDVGLELTSIHPHDRERLSSVLDRA